MKDYKLSEIRDICKKHIDDKPMCKNCKFVQLYGNCIWYNLLKITPCSWIVTEEKGADYEE